MRLTDRIRRGDGGLLLFSITPPRRSTSPERAQEIADTTLQRLAGLELDGLMLYDIDDESDRNAQDRPFPYLPTMDPDIFRERHLQAWHGPVVVYRSVGKYDEPALADWLAAQDTGRTLAVFVGAPSGDRPVRTALPRAHALHRDSRPDLLLGGVAIPERHAGSGDEHQRMLRKQDSGCTFFVTQVVYDAGAAKSMVSDYHYERIDRGLAPVPVVFTLSVCGSAKTLAFLEWLGVEVPRWLHNELKRSADPLATSVRECLVTARDLADYCRRHGIPFGFNVESVSIRRAEIEASVGLAAQLRDLTRP